MPHDNEQPGTEPATEHQQPDELQDAHEPEWMKVFGELQDEADQLYPDGRVRVVIPRRRRRHAGSEGAR